MFRPSDLTRLPEPETVADATQGIELDCLKVLLDAWRQHDWRRLEERWNAIPHYRTQLMSLAGMISAALFLASS